MRTSVKSLAVVPMLAMLACAPSDPRPASLLVRVVRETGAPLPGVVVTLDGQQVARTMEGGETWLVLGPQVSGRVQLGVRCPEGFRSPEARNIRARHPSARTFELRCEATHHDALLIVRARGGAGLPVRVNGEKIGSVGSDGTLHARIRRAAGSELRMTIDTRARPELRPREAVLTARLDRDEVFLFDQTFRVEVPKARRSARRTIAGASTPRRLRSL